MSLCKRKKEEEAVAGVAVCVMISNYPEGISVEDIPQINEKEQNCSIDREATSYSGLVSNQDCNPSAHPRETCKRKKEEVVAAHHASCGIISKTPERCRESYKRTTPIKNSATNKNRETLMERDKTEQLKKECNAEPAVVTSGTASKVISGPSIGVVDIGVNKSAYFFQVALPGVCKDSREFSCEVESDGKVILEGSTTTGCKKIKRHSRVFKMNIQNLCPHGPFKLSFSLPGPVDPRLFSPNFRSDGIFEAVVIRHDKSI